MVHMQHEPNLRKPEVLNEHSDTLSAAVLRKRYRARGGVGVGGAEAPPPPQHFCGNFEELLRKGVFSPTPPPTLSHYSPPPPPTFKVAPQALRYLVKPQLQKLQTASRFMKIGSTYISYMSNK